MQEENHKIYQSQVLIPFFIAGETHAFLGHLHDFNISVEKLKDFFPAYHRTNLIASKRKIITASEDVSAKLDSKNAESKVKNKVDSQVKPSIEAPKPKDPTGVKLEKIINLDYMSNALRVFRSCPLFRYPETYLVWLAKVKQKKAQIWTEMGILDMIQLSKVEPGYCQNMMVTSLYFWDSTTNTFHLPCGMITPNHVRHCFDYWSSTNWRNIRPL